MSKHAFALFVFVTVIAALVAGTVAGGALASASGWTAAPAGAGLTSTQAVLVAAADFDGWSPMLDPINGGSGGGY
jgi:type IV secretory pathway TrbL component